MFLTTNVAFRDKRIFQNLTKLTLCLHFFLHGIMMKYIVKHIVKHIIEK